MKISASLLSVALAGLFLVQCGGSTDPVQLALDSIQDTDLHDWTRHISSDEFEGRGPSSPGEEKTVAFLESEFMKLGLLPGNGDSYFQEVPLVDITVEGAPELRLGAQTLSFGTDGVFWTKRVIETIELVESEIVFVGYGVVAPEYSWNDYEGLDVTGKTVLILVNDPGYATEEASIFNGKAMTYYGRWTYKYEEAARQGAAGALIIHDTGPAGYGWETVRNSWTGPQFDLVRADNNMSRVAVEGWITNAQAQAVLTEAGLALADLQKKSLQSDFQARELGLSASVAFQNEIRRSTSRNVIAMIPGESKPDEYVLYMAHWDHLGKDSGLEGDQIYNGALDNASGTAGLLSLAKAYATLPYPPYRSVVFLSVTAEEQGLLGSAYYADSPVFPPHQTVAAINMDGVNLLGPMKDITVVGFGNSELDDYLAEAAGLHGRTLRPDPEAEKGYYYRSDHFSLAKVGIPALYTDAGVDHLEHGEAWTMARREEYLEQNYHRVSDEYDPSWDLSGAVDDLRILFRVGYTIASSDGWPNWREGNEFRAIRDQQRVGR